MIDIRTLHTTAEANGWTLDGDDVRGTIYRRGDEYAIVRHACGSLTSASFFRGDAYLGEVDGHAEGAAERLAELLAPKTEATPAAPARLTARETVRRAVAAHGWSVEVDGDADLVTVPGSSRTCVIRYSTSGIVKRAAIVHPAISNDESDLWPQSRGKAARVLAWFDAIAAAEAPVESDRDRIRAAVEDADDEWTATLDDDRFGWFDHLDGRHVFVTFDPQGHLDRASRKSAGALPGPVSDEETDDAAVVLRWLDAADAVRPEVAAEASAIVPRTLVEAAGSERLSVCTNAAAFVAGARRAVVVADDENGRPHVEVSYRLGDDRTVETIAVPTDAADYRTWISRTLGINLDLVTLIDAEIDMTEVARMVREIYGVECAVDLTGGNVATIHAGGYVDAECCATHVLCVAGPGAWGGPAGHSIGHVSDFSIGIDDHGDGPAVDAIRAGAWTTNDLAALIAAQVASCGAALSPDHLDALGFDGTGRWWRAIDVKTPEMYGARILADILADHEAGCFSSLAIEGFSDLHDYVDANQYLLDAGVPTGRSGDSEVDNLVWNLVQDIVDHAIVCGALRGVSVPLSRVPHVEVCVPVEVVAEASTTVPEDDPQLILGRLVAVMFDLENVAPEFRIARARTLLAPFKNGLPR